MAIPAHAFTSYRSYRNHAEYFENYLGFFFFFCFKLQDGKKSYDADKHVLQKQGRKCFHHQKSYEQWDHALSDIHRYKSSSHFYSFFLFLICALL